MIDSKTILDIAKQFLLSDQGKKLLEKAKNIDAQKVQDDIKKDIADIKEDRENRKNLTPEERKARRQERRQQRKEEREERREERGRKLAENLPYLGIYTTKGRVYDKNTKEPVEGIGVIPQLCVFPILKEPRINSVTDEVLTDEEGNILYQAIKDKDLEDQKNKDTVEEFGNFQGVKTDENGEWEITFGVPVIDALDRIVLPKNTVPFVFYVDQEDGPHTQSQIDSNLEGEYAPGAQVLVTLDGEVKQEQDPISLLEIQAAAKKEVKKAVDELNKFIVKQVGPYLDATETFLINLRNTVLKPAAVIQTKLFPLAFQLMLYFGIAKEEQARQGLQKCPDGALLAEVIKKRNSIVRQINNIYAIIVANTALAFLFLFLSKYLVGISKVISNLSFPVSVPPGVGVPYALISKLEGVQDILEKLSDVNKDLKKNLLIALIFLIVSLIIILRYLKTIDNLIRECSDTADLTAINAELLALQEQDTNQGEPILNNVNGFDLSVEVVDKYQVGELPRRQAIAKNAKGIVILRGEPSFAAEDQILIDELAFYIVQNNLKAD
tara:strand:+ start:1460 stop:3118 length:1659 start_codon:yes stop_codon:yes gene_type:complete